MADLLYDDLDTIQRNDNTVTQPRQSSNPFDLYGNLGINPNLTAQGPSQTNQPNNQNIQNIPQPNTQTIIRPTNTVTTTNQNQAQTITAPSSYSFGNAPQTQQLPQPHLRSQITTIQNQSQTQNQSHPIHQSRRPSSGDSRFKSITNNNNNDEKLVDPVFTGVAYQHARQFQSNVLYVGGLDWWITDSELRKTFDQFGSVRQVKIHADKVNGKSKGFGYVEYAPPREIDAAINAQNTLNGFEINDCRIRVAFAIPDKIREKEYTNTPMNVVKRSQHLRMKSKRNQQGNNNNNNDNNINLNDGGGTIFPTGLNNIIPGALPTPKITTIQAPTTSNNNININKNSMISHRNGIKMSIQQQTISNSSNPTIIRPPKLGNIQSNINQNTSQTNQSNTNTSGVGGGILSTFSNPSTLATILAKQSKTTRPNTTRQTSSRSHSRSRSRSRRRHGRDIVQRDNSRDNRDIRSSRHHDRRIIDRERDRIRDRDRDRDRRHRGIRNERDRRERDRDRDHRNRPDRERERERDRNRDDRDRNIRNDRSNIRSSRGPSDSSSRSDRKDSRRRDRIDKIGSGNSSGRDRDRERRRHGNENTLNRSGKHSQKRSLHRSRSGHISEQQNKDNDSNHSNGNNENNESKNNSNVKVNINDNKDLNKIENDNQSDDDNDKNNDESASGSESRSDSEGSQNSGTANPN